jgi:hypothetical protein
MAGKGIQDLRKAPPPPRDEADGLPLQLDKKLIPGLEAQGFPYRLG